jgi:phospholipase C
MSTYVCYVTIDNTQNPNSLALVSSNPTGSYVTPPPRLVPARTVLRLQLNASWTEGPSDTLVWTTGTGSQQATITLTFSDPLDPLASNQAAINVGGSPAAMLAYGVSYFYASAGDSTGAQPMQRDYVSPGGDPVRVNYSIVQNKIANQPAQWSLKGIKRVVWYMLENRGLDHLMGQLYTENSRNINFWPLNSSPRFNGLGANPTFSNTYFNQGTGRSQTVTANPVPYPIDDVPNPDPNEVWEHINVQIFGSNPPRGQCTMGGFLQDYATVVPGNAAQQMMQFYQPKHVPTISHIANRGAISDAWFCSVPSETYANRAFSISGTSDGLVNNQVLANPDLGEPPFYANTIFNIMTNCGFNDWAIYANDTWPPSDSTPELCFTAFQFQQLYDLVGDNTNPQRIFNWNDLINGALSSTLPAFCYVEPAWYVEEAGITYNGTDYHPPGNLAPGEKALRDLFVALFGRPGAGEDTLLIITFDEHGGTIDHVCPPATIPPDKMRAAPHYFDFNRFGVRVTTILASPHVQGYTVFRSPTSTPFDHTSLLRTVLGWRGIDVSGGAAGARAAVAPDFSGVVSPTAATEDNMREAVETMPAPPVVKPANKQRPLSGLERSMAGFWAYKIVGGKRGNPEHVELAKRIANAKTIGEMEQIVYAAVAEKKALRGGK